MITGKKISHIHCVQTLFINVFVPSKVSILKLE